MTYERAVSLRYLDPIEEIWISLAAAVGLRVQRSSEVFASTDGRGVMRIGSSDTLDPDDCLAQMVLHELCHALVEGPQSASHPDWGLRSDQRDSDDELRERACLRVQAYMTQRFGLRELLAATTEFRQFYDELSASPLDGTTEDARRAQRAIEGAQRVPWFADLECALDATARIAEVVHEVWRRVGQQEVGRPGAGRAEAGPAGVEPAERPLASLWTVYRRT